MVIEVKSNMTSDIAKNLYDALRRIEDLNWEPDQNVVRQAREAMDEYENDSPHHVSAILKYSTRGIDKFIQNSKCGDYHVSFTDDIDAAELFEGSRAIQSAVDRVSRRVGVKPEVKYV